MWSRCFARCNRLVRSPSKTSILERVGSRLAQTLPHRFPPSLIHFHFDQLSLLFLSNQARSLIKMPRRTFSWPDTARNEWGNRQLVQVPTRSQLEALKSETSHHFKFAVAHRVLQYQSAQRGAPSSPQPVERSSLKTLQQVCGYYNDYLCVQWFLYGMRPDLEHHGPGHRETRTDEQLQRQMEEDLTDLLGNRGAQEFKSSIDRLESNFEALGQMISIDARNPHLNKFATKFSSMVRTLLRTPRQPDNMTAMNVRVHFLFCEEGWGGWGGGAEAKCTCCPRTQTNIRSNSGRQHPAGHAGGTGDLQRQLEARRVGRVQGIPEHTRDCVPRQEGFGHLQCHKRLAHAQLPGLGGGGPPNSHGSHPENGLRPAWADPHRPQRDKIGVHMAHGVGSGGDWAGHDTGRDR